MSYIRINSGNDHLGIDPSETTSGGGFLPVNGTGGSSFNTGQVTCASAVAATAIVPANPSRLAITFYNNQNGATWLANTSASTTASSTGFKLPGQTFVTFHTQAAIWGLASSGTTAVTSWAEEAL